MRKNDQTNPENSQKITQHSCCSMLTREKNESNKRQWILFRPQRWDVPYRNHQACCEKLWFVRSLYPNLPQMGQNLYHSMLMPLHDSMLGFMNIGRILDLQEIKNQASQCFAGNQWCPGVWNSFPFLAWDLSMHPRTQIWFFNQFIRTGAYACSANLNYAHKCIKNSLNAKKCPNEPRKITKNNTTLLLFYVDMRKFLKAIRGTGYCFVPKGGTFPTKPSCLLWETLVCEKHIPKPTPNGTKNLPQHVDAAPR